MSRIFQLLTVLFVGTSAGVVWAEAPVPLPAMDASVLPADGSLHPISATAPQATLLPVREYAIQESCAMLAGHSTDAVPPAPAPPMPPAMGGTSGDPVAERLQQLEAETAALREEVTWLRSHPAPAAGTAAPAAPRLDPKKIAWTKGDFQIVPYGALWGTMAYDTERTYPGEYPLYAESASTAGESAFELDIRRTRLGLDIAGPDIAFFDAHSGGKVEIDFMGSSLGTENKAGVLLRHAYWQVKNEDYALLVGQSWDTISPLFNNTISYSVGWFGGNIGYRRAQVRLDRYLTFSDVSMVTATLSANQDIISDFPTQASVNREPSDWPILEGRLGWTLGPRGKGCNPITLGVSSHIGKQQFDFAAVSGSPLDLPAADDVQVITWSINTDLRVPITDRFGVQNELFYGENLGAFFGGIGQGVCSVSRQAIRSRGGWVDVWYDWTPRLHSTVGMGLDDPIDNDLYVGRTYNHFVYGNVVFDITKQLQVGLELSNWKTLYKDDRTPTSTDPLPGDSYRIEAMAKYAF